MDNISHAVFGASITHAIRGKRYGNKVLGYSVIASNLPDIDFIVKIIPGIDPVRADFAHRTLTHSFSFAVFIALILGWVVSRITKSGKKGMRDWSLITLVSILSHIFLDRCTTYGVWFLQPFSGVGFESRIISVIDVFFTLPLIGIFIRYLIITSRKKHQKKTGWSRYIGIGFATLYLSMMALLQTNLKASIASDMELGGVTYTSIFAAPQILQPFLRYGIVALPDGSYKTTYTSVFDTKPRLYENIYGYHDIIDSEARKNSYVSILIDRSFGRYVGSQQGPSLIFSDMRFGRILGRDKENRGNYMFSFILGDDGNIQHIRPGFTQPFSFIRKEHWKRVWGN